ncbi:hypothetical protein F5887DRAFT_1149383 [Amanita rubescens]|nr:hypothetical protein F5887DRAFT_1149383 [Amanita rubescens]
MLPQAVLDEFLDIPPETTDENEWYGAWNVLLTKYFPIDEGQRLTLVATRPDHLRTREAVDFGVLFKIVHQKMFVEIKLALATTDSLSARGEADTQMRQRFVHFYDATPTIFTGLSAFGYIICKYELNKDDGNRITPAVIQNSPNRVIYVAPRARWDLDLTTAEGAARIQAIFQEVKNVILNEGACNYNFKTLAE